MIHSKLLVNRKGNRNFKEMYYRRHYHATNNYKYKIIKFEHKYSIIFFLNISTLRNVNILRLKLALKAGIILVTGESKPRLLREVSYI